MTETGPGLIAHHPADEELRRTFDALGFITYSEVMTPVLRQANKAAMVSDVTVLVEGETGTGKQVLAQAIHCLDVKRKALPFVTVHCGTINEALAESEFFGHTKGAFSGAVCDRKGLFRSAHLGTLFLDDVKDLPMYLQAKLLDVIQRGVVRPVGSDQEKLIDVRIIAACNQPLRPLVLQNKFRSDLYHRLNVIKLFLPPLRSRSQDLPRLILVLARRHSDLYQPIEAVEPELVRVLQSQPLSGNVRELENGVQRMLFAKTDGTSLGVADWMKQVAPEKDEPDAPADQGLLDQAAVILWKAISKGAVSYKRAIHEVETRIVETAMRASGGTRREVANLLNTSERTLYYKIRAHRRGNPPVL
jgi:transcriptional regulator with PAS, ATPase and Fis domain